MTIQTENVTKDFGGLRAVDNVTLTAEDEVLGLMGPNGSGKSTFLNCVSGIYELTSGRVFHNGSDITGQPAYKNAREGIGRTFQTPQVFTDLSVLENVTVPLLYRNLKKKEIEQRARDRIDFVELDHVIELDAKELSGGQKKLLEFARILMTDPDIILMDEPFAGVHPRIKGKMFSQIKTLHEDEGVDFLVVSHEVESLHEICNRTIVFERGSIIADGTPTEIQNNDRVVEAYLGGV